MVCSCTSWKQWITFLHWGGQILKIQCQVENQDMENRATSQCDTYKGSMHRGKLKIPDPIAILPAYDFLLAA